MTTVFDGFVTATYTKGSAPTYTYDKDNLPAHQISGNHSQPGYWFAFALSEDGAFWSDFGTDDAMPNIEPVFAKS